MDQDKRTVPDLSEGEGQGGEVPAGEKAGDEDPLHGDGSREQEGTSAADSGGRGDAASESDEEGVIKEALAEESKGVAVACTAGRGAASESANNEDHEAPKNPLAVRFWFRAAIAHPTPPTTYRRLPLRSRKQYNPTRFIAVGAAPATTRSAGISAMSTADQVAMNEAQGSTVTFSELDATIDKSSSDEIESGTGATNAATSTSYRLPSRSRKQRRPDHFIPEEAEAETRAKARRSNIFHDRFLISLIRVSPEQRPEWVKNVMADDDRGQGQGGESGSRMASGEGPEEPDGRARIITVLAVLGASLALCFISCVLFYIIGQRTGHGSH